MGDMTICYTYKYKHISLQTDQKPEAADLALKFCTYEV